VATPLTASLVFDEQYRLVSPQQRRVQPPGVALSSAGLSNVGRKTLIVVPAPTSLVTVIKPLLS
jgi:hypothetical protein